MERLRAVITGTGSYIPQVAVTNSDFYTNEFYTSDEERIAIEPQIITEKFRQITGIEERKYVKEDFTCSDIGTIAAKKAIEDSGIDPETIDQLIVAHNFGDVKNNSIQSDAVPSIAARIKHSLKIKNPACIPYDVLFGCPGWIQGLIQADAFIKAGLAKKCLIVGTETLSRVIDPHDRDSMIFSDGAGACILEGKNVDEEGPGILSTSAQAYCEDETYYLYMGKSNFPDSDPSVRYIKMNGRKVYEFAISHVPQAMKECLDTSGYSIGDVKKVFIHQANEKLDEGILKRFYQLFGKNEVPDGVMPMSIHKLGNSSVATVPTLLDMVKKEEIDGHKLHKNDVVLFASVGAGMNINAICYRM